MDELEWIRFVFRKINEFSDINLQKDVWVFGNKPDYVSSFEEAYCTLIEDLTFSDFIQEKILIKYGIDVSLEEELKKLYIMLEAYKEKDTDKEIVEDPEWHTVVNQAQTVMKLWEKEKTKISSEF
ncbi:hypothetical protein EHQ31_06525 [Leptospira montravelensis]|uniref:Uncharacterized protein n=1 Tax=Leptospira montravelensis TaxID=2484961 RepID=A0ABY2LST3_9LEPT|nr:hypothetical protein [Leptospira montravelensis]TGK87192.1 hypothetical protein EHQ19_00020 [Leptospira montravelensis]TGL04586.1 hypothetical protein EHQ31_06525 [Leptospira montravelensis]